MMLTQPMIYRYTGQLAAYSQPATVNQVGQVLKNFWEFARHKPLESAVFMDYRESLTQGRKASTVNKYFMVLKGFCAWLVDSQLIEVDPMPRGYLVNAETPKKKPITAAEFGALAATAPHEWKLPIHVAWHTGLRLSDVACMRRESIQVGESTIRLTPRKTKRRGKVVEIPIPSNLAAVLAAIPTEQLFPCMCESYHTDGGMGLSKEFARLAARAGVNNSFHGFRHARITRLVEKGVNTALIGELLGISVQTVSAYCHASLDAKREALAL